ncbi:hypothetical protein J6590_051664 [Homalodisca vitripennis]|nr:hypothetical protein J6590_051664 [Homalodisca vitripennis]
MNRLPSVYFQLARTVIKQTGEQVKRPSKQRKTRSLVVGRQVPGTHTDTGLLAELLGLGVLSNSQPADQRLTDDFRTIDGREGRLLARPGSLSGNRSKQQPRSTLVRLSRDNRLTRYTAPLAKRVQKEVRIRKFCCKVRRSIV